MKSILITFIILFSFAKLHAQDKKEVAIYLSPLSISEPENYKLLYRQQLNDHWSLRLGASAFAQTDKETRSDSVTLNAGRIAYSFSGGAQRKLAFDGIENVTIYVGADVYYNSEFRREAYEIYYGYYWDFGMNPLVGLSYQPFDHIKLSLESLGDANVNLQQYSAPGANGDQRFRFSLVDRIGVAIGYTF